jgi:hypothetical protein
LEKSNCKIPTAYLLASMDAVFSKVKEIRYKTLNSRTLRIFVIRKKHNKTAKKALARSSKIENPTNDALPPAFGVYLSLSLSEKK